MALSMVVVVILVVGALIAVGALVAAIVLASASRARKDRAAGAPAVGPAGEPDRPG